MYHIFSYNLLFSRDLKGVRNLFRTGKIAGFGRFPASLTVRFFLVKQAQK
jgi:hypothetical protein